MTEKTSKYILAIRTIGRPCSPKQIRAEVNLGEDDGKLVTPQNVASALNNLLSDEKISRGEDGLYYIPDELNNNKTKEPI